MALQVKPNARLFSLESMPSPSYTSNNLISTRCSPTALRTVFKTAAAGTSCRTTTARSRRTCGNLDTLDGDATFASTTSLCSSKTKTGGTSICACSCGCSKPTRPITWPYNDFRTLSRMQHPITHRQNWLLGRTSGKGLDNTLGVKEITGCCFHASLQQHDHPIARHQAWIAAPAPRPEAKYQTRFKARPEVC